MAGGGRLTFGGGNKNSVRGSTEGGQIRGKNQIF